MSFLGPRLGGGLAGEASFSEEVETDDDGENLAAQAIVLAIIVGLYFFGKARLAREAAQSRAED